MIKITKTKPDNFIVEVETSDGKTSHNVVLKDSYYENLINGEISKEELIEKSFEFLLKKESNQSILREFNLEKINDYFPEFEKVIN